MKEYIILVDTNDNEIGTGEKMKVHMDGHLHRAFSIFIFNDEEKMLIHKRAEKKYHCGGLWTNTCCSHPRAGETIESAAHRRLQEELGFDCDILKIFDFVYKAEFDHGLTEYEFDHVFIGKYSGAVNLNPDEIDEIQWVDLDWLISDIEKKPHDYTPWFKIALPKVLEHVRKL